MVLFANLTVLVSSYIENVLLLKLNKQKYRLTSGIFVLCKPEILGYPLFCLISQS